MLSLRGKIFTICLILLLFLGAISSVTGTQVTKQDNNLNETPNQSIEPIPSNYRHRPIVEFFTGLSCPACMGGPHQDMDKLWEDNAANPEQPFTFVVFHELNGGGVDDLATDESRERMRYYQPGVSGTPDAEFDGGYVKLGGFSTTSINYQTATGAVQDCTDRYQRSFNPVHPLQSLRNDFKFVELYVDQVFTGKGYAVSVTAKYLGMDKVVSLESLRGSLYVFMVENHVEAYSTVLDENIINHNVFRGYAIKDQQINLQADEEYTTMVEWTIPEAKVPIKSGDITAVAAIYDLDDTTSEEGNSGNDAQVPRCIQSATPQSTAYDKDNDLPIVSEVNVQSKGDFVINAKLDDEDGVSVAYVIYNTEAANSTNWSYEEMEVGGEEICDDAGVCYAYADGVGTAILPVEGGDTVYFMILAYDGAGVDLGGIGAQGKSELYNFTSTGGARSDESSGSISFTIIAGAVGICLIIFLLFIIFKASKKNKRGNTSKTK
jgi:hypothetical protein